MSGASQLMQCWKCQRYMLRKNFYSHLRVVHNCSNDEVEAIKLEIARRHIPACTSHEPRTVVCPRCDGRFPTHELLANHCEESHVEEGGYGEPQDYTVFTVTFESKEDFDIWLEEIQQQTSTCFVKRSTAESGNMFKLRCNRAGEYIKKTESRATHTTKDVTHCSCFMNGRIDENGKVTVRGCLGHVGHEVEPALLRLTYAQQSYIKSLLEEFSNAYIIKRLRKEFSAEKSKLHYLTNADLWSIANRHGLRPGFRHQDDLQSLKMRQEEGNPEDGIRLFDMPEDPSGKGFRMVIITPQQLQWLNEYSHKGISVDDTHNATRYNLKLATVSVFNERDTGLPAAFLLSGTMTSSDVEALFLEIEKLVPDFNPKQIVTDEAACFYNGFRAVFPHSVAKLHYCRWHIDRTWQRSVNKLVEPRLRGQVKKMLRELLVIADLPTFERRFGEVLAFLSTESQVRMSDYLRKNYLGKPHVQRFCAIAAPLSKHFLGKTPTWASFSHEGAVLDTTMISERWHLRLKSEFLHRNANTRADSLVELLIRAVKELSESDQIKARRRLAKASYRTRESTVCHREAMKDYATRLHLINRIGSEKWEVGSGSQMVCVQREGGC